MWLGKMCIIFWLFSVALLGVAYIMYEGIGVRLFDNGTSAFLDAIVARSEVSTQVNPNFVFGDFVATIQAVAALIWDTTTGGAVGSVLFNLSGEGGGAGLLTQGGVLLFRVLYSVASAFFVFSLLSGRDV